jgi:hypothetical protein
LATGVRALFRLVGDLLILLLHVLMGFNCESIYREELFTFLKKQNPLRYFTMSANVQKMMFGLKVVDVMMV